MTWLYYVVLIFSLLTLHFLYKEYVSSKISKKIFIFVSILEIIVIIGTILLSIFY